MNFLIEKVFWLDSQQALLGGVFPFKNYIFSQVWIKYRIFGYGKQALTVNSKSNPISGYIRLFQNRHSADV